VRRARNIIRWVLNRAIVSAKRIGAGIIRRSPSMLSHRSAAVVPRIYYADRGLGMFGCGRKSSCWGGERRRRTKDGSPEVVCGGRRFADLCGRSFLFPPGYRMPDKHRNAADGVTQKKKDAGISE